jgi:hypothetical protein
MDTKRSRSQITGLFQRLASVLCLVMTCGFTVGHAQEQKVRLSFATYKICNSTDWQCSPHFIQQG